MLHEAAKAAGYDVAVGNFNSQANGKALGLNDYAGWVKIVTDKKIRGDPGGSYGPPRSDPGPG